MPERKEATQDMYITELQKDGERTRTLLEEYRGDLERFSDKMDKVIEKLAQMSSDERAARVATDGRIEKLEGSVTSMGVQVDANTKDIRCLKNAPGVRAETQLKVFWREAARYGIVGGLVLLLLGLKEWIQQVGM